MIVCWYCDVTNVPYNVFAPILTLQVPYIRFPTLCIYLRIYLCMYSFILVFTYVFT